jgi:hypothetical protein
VRKPHQVPQTYTSDAILDFPDHTMARWLDGHYAH